MKETFSTLAVLRNTAANRFELAVDGHIAFIDYIEKDAALIALVHTESPEELSGRGVATALIMKTLAYFKEFKIELIPLCPLVFAYIKKNPEWISIVVASYRHKFD